VKELRARAESSDPAAGAEERGLQAWLATGGAGGREGLTDTDLLRFIMFRLGLESWRGLRVSQLAEYSSGDEKRGYSSSKRQGALLSGVGWRDSKGCRGCRRKLHSSLPRCIRSTPVRWRDLCNSSSVTESPMPPLSLLMLLQLPQTRRRGCCLAAGAKLVRLGIRSVNNVETTGIPEGGPHHLTPTRRDFVNCAWCSGHDEC